MPDSFFLSARNPVANVDQLELEQTALRLLDRPEIAKARSAATLLWRNAVAYPAAEQMADFDGMIEEYVFNFVLRAVASDGGYPKVLRLMQPAHRWFGHDMPGSRWGGDSPDFTYRMIAIEHGGSYELVVRPSCADPATVTYTLMENMPSLKTLGILDSLDLVADEGGTTTITVDATPAAGRTNHLQTQPGVLHLLVRDAIGDWLGQTPMALTVRRLNGPGRPPLPGEELAQEAARQMLQSLYYVYYCTRSASGQAPNDIRPPSSAAPFGGMATQWGTKGNLRLQDDEALVLTMNKAGALFRNVTLSDLFFRSVNYWSQTGTFNMDQMASDDSGLFTFVVSHEDPGIHNWLDTGGRNQAIFGARWQAFDRAGSHETPVMTTRIAKFADLDAVLPAGVRRINGAGRRDQISRRMAGFDSRFIDN